MSSDHRKSVLGSGIGGVFSGVYIDRSGAHWCPDLIYAPLHVEKLTRDRGIAGIDPDRAVCVFHRDAAIIVNSGFRPDPIAYIFVKDDDKEAAEQEFLKVLDGVNTQLKRLSFFAVVLFAMEANVVAIQQMHYKKKTDFVSLKRMGAEGQAAVLVTINRGVVDAILGFEDRPEQQINILYNKKAKGPRRKKRKSAGALRPP